MHEQYTLISNTYAHIAVAPGHLGYNTRRPLSRITKDPVNAHDRVIAFPRHFELSWSCWYNVASVLTAASSSYLWKPGCYAVCHLCEAHLLARVKPHRQVLILRKITTYHEITDCDVGAVENVRRDGGSLKILYALRGGRSGDRVSQEFSFKLLLVRKQQQLRQRDSYAHALTHFTLHYAHAYAHTCTH